MGWWLCSLRVCGISLGLWGGVGGGRSGGRGKCSTLCCTRQGSCPQPVGNLPSPPLRRHFTHTMSPRIHWVCCMGKASGMGVAQSHSGRYQWSLKAVPPRSRNDHAPSDRRHDHWPRIRGEVGVALGKRHKGRAGKAMGHRKAREWPWPTGTDWRYPGHSSDLNYPSHSAALPCPPCPVVPNPTPPSSQLGFISNRPGVVSNSPTR